MRILLKLGTAFWALSAIPGAAMAMMAPMLFDAPGSRDNTLLIVAAIALMLFPLTAVLAPALSWMAWGRGHRRVAGWTMLLPLLPPAVFVGAIEFASLAHGPLANGPLANGFGTG